MVAIVSAVLSDTVYTGYTSSGMYADYVYYLVHPWTLPLQIFYIFASSVPEPVCLIAKTTAK